MSELTAIVLRDAHQGHFSPRQHELGEHAGLSSVYHLDLSPSLLKTIAMTGKGVFTYPIDLHRLCDVIECVEVWLSLKLRVAQL
jgi:hypothetical protein